MSEGNAPKPINLLVCQHQFIINPGITIQPNDYARIIDGTLLSALEFQTLDPIPSGRNLKAISFLWANGSQCFASDTLVQNGKATLVLMNAGTNERTITNIRVLAFWE